VTDAMPLLIGASIRATLLLGAALALTSLLRRASASTRHFVWSCAIAAAVVVPAIGVVVPQWQVRAPQALAPLSSAMAPRFSTDGATTPGSVGGGSRELGVDIRGDARAIPVMSQTSVPTERDYTAAVMSVWAAGTVAIVLYMLAGTIAVWRMRRSASPVDAQWVEDARSLAEAFDIAPSIAFVECASVTMPIVCGIRRPVMVMPRGAADWPEARLRVVVLHELAHIARRDCLTQALARIVCAAYWFNPLVWIAARRLRAERERACDDFVLAAGTKGSEYAGHLLEIARAIRPGLWSPLAGAGVPMAHQSQLEGRLMAILDPAIRRSSTPSARIVALGAVLLLSIPLAAVEVQPSAPIAPDILLPVTVAAGASNAAGQQANAAVVEPERPERSIETARFLLAKGAKIASTRIRGRAVDRALVEAAAEGDIEGINGLLVAGANVNARVDGDGSPLIAAAREGRIDIVRLLLDKGADPGLAVEGDGSPLIMAARQGHTAVVELLLQRGAGVDQIVPGDENALMQASAAGRLEMVKLLVARGADVNARVWAERYRPENGDPVGEWRSALSMARRGGHNAVVVYLLSIGAQD
jgi:beta-lactamase regulating signal transducer with metallopeptidase domain